MRIMDCDTHISVRNNLLMDENGIEKLIPCPIVHMQEKLQRIIGL